MKSEKLQTFAVILFINFFAAYANKDYGTVIGIDLGTTYSWYCERNCLFKLSNLTLYKLGVI